MIGKHTSILLDLKSRALVYEFLDVPLDESPIIPYSLKRRYIYSTPTGHISVTGKKENDMAHLFQFDSLFILKIYIFIIYIY